MNKRCTYLFFGLFLLLCSRASGQKVFFNGLGRTVVTNDALKGNILQNDTATSNKATNGYVLFDLGVNMQPTDYIRAKAIIRLKNQFGAFFGQGASVQFRQVLLEGLIAKKVRYALGDIDVQMTPYTVFNYEDTYHKYEADIFNIRRDFVYYQNFNVGNHWRIQGAKGYANLLFKNSEAKIQLNTFASRTRRTDYDTIPDRFLMGGSALADLSKGLKLGLNYVRFFDLPGQTGSTQYKNDVLTGVFNIRKENDHVLFKLSGEGGYSFYKNVISADSSAQYNGFFYDVALHFHHKRSGLRFFGGYKETGPYFSSPAAQTLRINITRTPALFPEVLNNQVNRGQLLYDRFTDAGIYNQTIMPVLMSFLPQYGNVLPYGEGTPNRMGWKGGMAVGSKDQLVSASGKAYILSEMVGEGTPSLRKFILVQGGASFQLHKLLGSQKIFILTVGNKYENTQRKAPATISLQTDQLDAGLTLETLKNLDLMAGYKSIYAKGNEYMATRNTFNKISRFTPITLNFKQNIFSVGLRYRFSNKSFFAVNGNYNSNNVFSDTGMSYRMNEYFITYSLMF